MSHITMTFADPGDFAAMRAAEQWCADNGYSVGCMQGYSPRGLLRGDWSISKWRNLTKQQRAELDGQMTGDMRGGPVTVKVHE